MTLYDFFSSLPLVILAFGSVFVLLAAAFARRKHAAAFGTSLVVLALSLASLLPTLEIAPRPVAKLLVVDGLTLLTFALLISSAFLVALISYPYLKRRPKERGEYYFLLILATLGACVLAAASSFVTLFLGLELLSTALFTLIAYWRERPSGAQAGFMYLVLAGVSSAFLLFGMALAYLDTGSLDVARLAHALAAGPRGFLAYAGLGFMVVGVGFKLALVPFHLWTPDIYDAAPAPVTAFIATVSKGAMAVFLVRLFAPVGGVGAAGIYAWLFAVIAGISMFTGNLLALREERIKRVLAYSSIAHLGYLMIAFVAGGRIAAPTVAFYLVTYFASTLGAFGAIALLSDGDGDCDELERYRALASRRPWIAAGLTLSLLSLAGLPLTAGFMGKFLLFTAGESAFLWVLAILLAVNSTISIFYYLRIVSLMYRPAEPESVVFPPSSVVLGARTAMAAPPTGALALAIAAAVVLALGIFPQPLLGLVRALVVGH